MAHFSNVVLKNEQSTLPKVADGLLFVIRSNSPVNFYIFYNNNLFIYIYSLLNDVVNFISPMYNKTRNIISKGGY